MTGYAATFEKDGQRVLVLVSRAPLRRPAKAEPMVRHRRDDEPDPTPVPVLYGRPAEPTRLRRERNKDDLETIQAARRGRQGRSEEDRKGHCCLV